METRAGSVKIITMVGYQMDVKFVMFNAEGQRKDFPITEAKTVVGRSKSCELRIPLASISRRHCEVTLFEDILGIRDLSSTNGTYVNNERVTDFELDAGDRVVVGPVVFTVQIDGIPDEIEPVVSDVMQAVGEGATIGQDVVELDKDAAASQGEDDSSGTKPGTVDVQTGDEGSISDLETMAAELDENQQEDPEPK